MNLQEDRIVFEKWDPKNENKVLCIRGYKNNWVAYHNIPNWTYVLELLEIKTFKANNNNIKLKNLSSELKPEIKEKNYFL